MKNLWQSMKKFSKKTLQILSNALKGKKDYLKEIEETIEKFRLMSVEEQFEYFIPVSISIENALVEGGFDNKVQIKYFTRFVKIIKTKIFTPRGEVVKHIELDSVYLKAISQVRRFINELHGVERTKEDRFLNILNHENKVIFNNTLLSSVAFFRNIIDELNARKLTLDKLENLANNIGDSFISKEDKIKEIISEALRKITEQDKINKLKIASEIFKKKARGYKLNSLAFLVLAAALAVGVFFFAFTNDIIDNDIIDCKIFECDINLSEKSNIDSGIFYIYLVLDFLLRGKLLFPIMALTGFFYCLRFYAASNHNAIICDQRANTLESFEALYENVEEDKERLLVVEKVLNSATEHLPTGFSKQQSDSGGGGIDPSKLLSLFKGK